MTSGLRSTRWLAVLGAMAMFVAACSGGSDDRVATDESVNAPAGTTEIATDSNVTTARPDDVSTTAAADVPATRVDGSTGKDIVTRSPDAVGDGDPPEGFTTATVEVTSADGEVCEICVWLADESSERQRGLMGVGDLNGPVGMAFAWDAPTDGRFFMFGTPTPLSIAWFSDDGTHVGQTDMEPCLTSNSSECELYGADAPYVLAIEMFQDQLGKVGIGPGSTARVTATSDSATCPFSP